MDDIHGATSGSLTDDTDPEHWVQAFMFKTQINPSLAADREWLTGWFSLALLAGEQKGLHGADEVFKRIQQRVTRARVICSMIAVLAVLAVILNALHVVH